MAESFSHADCEAVVDRFAIRTRNEYIAQSREKAGTRVVEEAGQVNCLRVGVIKVQRKITDKLLFELRVERIDSRIFVIFAKNPNAGARGNSARRRYGPDVRPLL